MRRAHSSASLCVLTPHHCPSLPRCLPSRQCSWTRELTSRTDFACPYLACGWCRGEALSHCASYSLHLAALLSTALLFTLLLASCHHAVHRWAKPQASASLCGIKPMLPPRALIRGTRLPRIAPECLHRARPPPCVPLQCHPCSTHLWPRLCLPKHHPTQRHLADPSITAHERSFVTSPELLPAWYASPWSRCCGTPPAWSRYPTALLNRRISASNATGVLGISSPIFALGPKDPSGPGHFSQAGPSALGTKPNYNCAPFLFPFRIIQFKFKFKLLNSKSNSNF
jgi:hypothetical protein